MQDKLKIAVVINDQFHPEMGGAFGYYESLVNAIDKYQFNPLLEFVFVRFSEGKDFKFKREFLQFTFDEIIPEEEHCKKRIKQINRIPFLFIKQPLRKRYESRIPNLKIDQEAARKMKLESWLQNNNIDLVYYLTPHGGEYNFPFVTTHWDVGHYTMYAFPEVIMNGTFERREKLYQKTYKKALAIFCESVAGENELVKYKQINPDKIYIVPLFPGKLVDLEINIEEQKSIIEQKFTLKARQYFLYPAQFWSHKNHYNLLIAFKKVNGKYPDLKLVLPGSDKGNLEYLKEVISNMELHFSVILPGFISNKELYSLYKNAIALVMPTFLGPTNMPLLEAAFLGCPVITSCFEGHKEILGEFATYINPLDEDEIANAMIKEYEAEEKIRKNFKNEVNTIQTAIRKVEEIFLKIRKIRKTWGGNFKQF